MSFERGEQVLMVRDVFPDLAQELRNLLLAQGETSLAQQVDALAVVDRCRCTDDFCAMFYTAPRPERSWGPGHRNVALVPEQGDLILDVLDDRIVAVEVLFRNEIRDKLRTLLPAEETRSTP